MKKLLFLLIITVSLPLVAQKFSSESIPQVDGQVQFRVELKTQLDKATAHERIVDFVKNKKLQFYSVRFTADNEDTTVCRVIDYVEISNQPLQIFAMYMTYTLFFEYSDNLCIVTFSSIKFMEMENFEERERAQELRKPMPERVEYSANYIMIDKHYREAFIRNASQKVSDAAINRINGIVKQLEKEFLR